MEMPLHPTWFDIFIRLLLTILAGAALGINRETQGQAAGLRTTILVALAASASMIQANLLLSVAGKTGSSFSMMDVLRFPLGILTGMGFIGAGSILKKGELVTGVTTAATLWTVTVIGLCFGGGQLYLGIVATLLSVFVLWFLKWVDIRVPRNQRARVSITADEKLSYLDLNELIKPFGYYAHFLQQVLEDNLKYMVFEIHWLKSDKEAHPTQLLDLLENHYQVKSFELTAEKMDHWI